MNRIVMNVCVAAAVALTIAAAVVQGRLANRWDKPADLTAAAERLKAFQQDVGPWRAAGSYKLTPQVTSTLQCAGYIYRRYVNANTGEAVVLAVLVGPPGPISVHTPEICYSGADYTQMGERQAVSLGNEGSNQSAWLTQFQARDLGGEALRVYYAWSDGRTWTAAEQPRVAFAGQSLLYKFQLAVQMPAGAAPDAGDPGKAFLNALLPALRSATAAGEAAANAP
jgi:hypothetical protein